jgi:hypothetical protein
MAEVFGFNSRDAEDLIAGIGGGDRTERLSFEPRTEAIRFIRFELTTELLTATATADIFDVDGTSIEEGATLEDPETIFTGLTATTRGIGIQQGSRYFIVNSNCPAEEEE